VTPTWVWLVEVAFFRSAQTLRFSLLPPAQLNIALHCPALLAQTLLLSFTLPFTLLLCFALGCNRGVAFFKDTRACILGYPFTQKKHGDENEDDECCNDLASEYVC
jgi:hypothetical protein